MIVLRNTDEELERNLTPNFKGKEFRCKCKQCYVTLISSKLLYSLETLRRIWGEAIYLNSAYRCQQHNRGEAKGSDYSTHISGRAVDLALPLDEGKRERFITLLKAIFPYTKIYSVHIHCDVRGR